MSHTFKSSHTYESRHTHQTCHACTELGPSTPRTHTYERVKSHLRELTDMKESCHRYEPIMHAYTPSMLAVDRHTHSIHVSRTHYIERVILRVTNSSIRTPYHLCIGVDRHTDCIHVSRTHRKNSSFYMCATNWSCRTHHPTYVTNSP